MIANILLGLVVLIFLLFGLAWYVSSKVIISPREIIKDEWKKYALWPQPVEFQASDGLHLAGVFLQGSLSATIILLHGYGRSKEQLLPQADFLNKAGFNVFMFDFRGSGESAGKYITFGVREQRDLSGAVNYLKSRPNVDIQRLGVLGFSMGGAVAVMKSGDIPEIKAIAVSSTYAHFKSVIWQNFRQYLSGMPFFPIGYIVLWMIKYRTGISYRMISPVKYLHKLKARPLLLIHGAHDKKVPLENAMELYRQTPWLEEFWLARGANHDDLYDVTKPDYEQKVASFFRKYLLRD